MRRIGQMARMGLLSLLVLILGLVAPMVVAAPYAAFVMDARTGEVIHSNNADTPLHPASLTKMMTLYVAFVAIQRGEISLDTEVTVTQLAANEPPSRLGLRAGQQIRLRYLLRAAAVKSANDAATAIGVAIAGSEEAFAARMNATARAMGMNNTHFIHMHGLTAQGHYSTARDMSVLGRHLIYDFPQYYNLFSRRTADAGVAQVNNTNTRFLDNYRGADGIKTGYTVAAGYNLTASAERNGVRIIATVFGGTSTANRNARVAELLDMGFAAAPANAEVRPPLVASAQGNAAAASTANVGDARVIRTTGLVDQAWRPQSRPTPGSTASIAGVNAAVDAAVSAVVEDSVNAALAEALGLDIAEMGGDQISTLDLRTMPGMTPEQLASLETLTAASVAEAPESRAAPAALAVAPPARPSEVILTRAEIADMQVAAPEVEMISRDSSNNPRVYGINAGRYNSRATADRVLIQVIVGEASVLEGGVRRIDQTARGWEANVVGLTRETAELACRRLQARGIGCETIGG